MIEGKLFFGSVKEKESIYGNYLQISITESDIENLVKTLDAKNGETARTMVFIKRSKKGTWYGEIWNPSAEQEVKPIRNGIFSSNDKTFTQPEAIIAEDFPEIPM